MKVDISTNAKPLGDELSQGSAVFVGDPAIGANKGQRTLWGEQRESSFNEGDIKVRPIIKRGEAFPVFSMQNGRELFNANIGRIPDDDIKHAGDGSEQKVSAKHPSVNELLGGGLGDVEFAERCEECVFGALDVRTVNIKSEDVLG